MRIFVLLLIVSGFCLIARAETPPEEPTVSSPPVPHGSRTSHNKKSTELTGTSTKLIPLPIYATLPNEGSTFGFMPVFLIVENKTQRTQSIVAPSISWNDSIKFTHTFRWYYYPTADKTITLIPSFSTHINRGVLFEYADLPRAVGEWTTETSLRIRRSLFFRFFGLGPDTTAGDETSYTRAGGYVNVRQGYNITKYLNIGAKVEFQRDVIESQGVPGIPLTTDVFRGTPGMSGAATAYQGLSIRYDTRYDRQFALNGWASELSGGIAEGITGADAYSKVEWESRLLFQETSFLQGAARAYWGYEGGNNIPFYYQSSLGGSYRLRGFTEDRFIDKGAWELEFEQRVGLFQTHIYGVTTDWRIDPFVALGQVYSDLDKIADHVRVSGGLGFRAWVHPNVLGRVDTAVGGEGIKVYVELGYPF